MDDLDQRLIALLRKDARTTVATLAAKLQVSRGTVTNRITRLEDDGVIVGYTVRLRPDAQPNDIRAWMSIAVEGNTTRAVIASLLGEPGVASFHLPSMYAPLGWRAWDVLAGEFEAAANDPVALKVFVNNELAECWEERRLNLSSTYRDATTNQYCLTAGQFFDNGQRLLLIDIDAAGL